MDKKKVKHDDTKLQWALFDIHIRQELSFMCSIIRSMECMEEDIVPNLMLVLGFKNYILAAAMVMQLKGVTEDEIVRIYTEGAKKYTVDNWKSVRPISRYLSAGMRHMHDGINKNDFGGSHWGYFCWNMVAMRWFEKQGEVIL